MDKHMYESSKLSVSEFLDGQQAAKRYSIATDNTTLHEIMLTLVDGEFDRVWITADCEENESDGKVIKVRLYFA
jgi:hypothetical protein